jgi:hypothetical protein
MIRAVVGLLMVTTSATGAAAQFGGRCGPPITWPTLSERVDVMHNLNTRTEVAQPAFIQWTDPAGKRSEAAISVATKFVACSNASVDLRLSGEYLWNTAADSRQNAWRGLLELEWQPLLIDSGANTHSPILTAQAGIKDDNEGQKEAVQASLLYTHLFRNSGVPLPNSTWSIGPVDLTYSPAIGLVFEEVRTKTDDVEGGSILRGVGQVDASIYPFAVQLERHIELGATYAYRYDIVDNTTESDDDHPFFRATLNLLLFADDEKSAGVSLAFVDGEDPTRAFNKSQFWQFGATLRIK